MDFNAIITSRALSSMQMTLYFISRFNFDQLYQLARASINELVLSLYNSCS